MMKCDKCGYDVNPGDRICLNCGAKLSNNNAVMPEVEKVNIEEKKDKKNFIILIVLGVIIVIIFVLLFVFLGK